MKLNAKIKEKFVVDKEIALNAGGLYVLGWVSVMKLKNR